MTRQRFEELVGDALDLLPPEFAAAMSNVVVLVEDRHPEVPSLLGLYTGIALTRRTTDYGGVLPDRITIYREAILDICATEECREPGKLRSVSLWPTSSRRMLLWGVDSRP
jgi:predicted Zn-dependent protease with MMP-like domain